MSIKLRLKEVAAKRKMSIYRVGKECSQRFGITTVSVSNWANGRTLPTVANLKDLCEVLGCKSSDLLGF